MARTQQSPWRTPKHIVSSVSGHTIRPAELIWVMTARGTRAADA